MHQRLQWPLSTFDLLHPGRTQTWSSDACASKNHLHLILFVHPTEACPMFRHFAQASLLLPTGLSIHARQNLGFLLTVHFSSFIHIILLISSFTFPTNRNLPRLCFVAWNFPKLPTQTGWLTILTRGWLRDMSSASSLKPP